MIRIYKETVESLWQKAYKTLLDELKHHEKSLMLLSGGSVVSLYPSISEYIKFQTPQMALGLVDERFQPLNKEDMNATVISQTGLWDCAISAKVPYHVIGQEGPLERVALTYNTVVTKLFEEYPHKIAILGIGEDSHTAGLLPGYQKGWDRDRYVVGYRNEGRFPQRISLTPDALRKLDYALVIAMGEKKREALTNIMLSENKANINIYPGAILQSCKKVDIYTDLDL